MCENNTCAVHNRVSSNKREFEYGEEFITRITYVNEWAVFTDDNPFILHMMALNKGLFPHMTLVVKVGENGTLADANESNPHLKGAVYDAFFDKDVDTAENTHEMVVFGIESGLFEYERPIDPTETIANYGQD